MIPRHGYLSELGGFAHVTTCGRVIFSPLKGALEIDSPQNLTHNLRCFTLLNLGIRRIPPSTRARVEKSSELDFHGILCEIYPACLSLPRRAIP